MVKEAEIYPNGVSVVVGEVTKIEEQEQQRRSQRRRGRRRRRRGRLIVCASDPTENPTRDPPQRTRETTEIRHDNGIVRIARMRCHAASWSFAFLAATVALVPATHTPPFEHAA